MLTRKLLVRVAALTAILFGLSALQAATDPQGDKDFLIIVDDIIWFGFLLSLLTLIVLTVAVLTRRRG